MDPMAKTKLTLNIEVGLIEEMKHQSIRERRSLSQITEALYRDYLNVQKGAGQNQTGG